MRRVLTLALAGAAALSFASTANAALVFNSATGNVTATSTTADGNNTITLTLDTEVNNAVVNGVLSQLVLTLTNVAANSYTFGYDLSMLSGDAKLVGFGFDTTPSLTSVTASGDLTAAKDVNFPNVGIVSACFYSGNNCGAANGKQTDFTGSFTLNLSSSDQLVLSTIVDRYAAITAADGVSGEGHVTTPPVPEPATWAMMLLGFGGIGFLMRRGRRQSGALMQVA